MSLWKVPDEETYEMMNSFYQNWLSGMTKQEALRQSALAILKTYRHQYQAAHPLLWGAFILLGNPD
jgi:CHAT domain-containing protein